MINDFEKISKDMDQLLEMIGEGVFENNSESVVGIELIKNLETNNNNIKEEIDCLFLFKISRLEDFQIKNLEKRIERQCSGIYENNSIQDSFIFRIYNIFNDFLYNDIENGLKKLKIIIDKTNEINEIIIDISQLKDFIDFIEKNQSNKLINDLIITVVKNDEDIYYGNNVLDDIKSLKFHLKNND